jgi:hypothetical protein
MALYTIIRYAAGHPRGTRCNRGGRYLQEVLPEGIRYSLCLLDLQSGAVVVLYDVHRGKSHHRHLRGKETSYSFVNEDTLLNDFFLDVSLILEGKL